MKRAFALICCHLGLWGFLGFLVTLLFGFLACCAKVSTNVFYISLAVFAVIGITATTICVSRGCKKKV
ncbi:MAG: hypothetical protein ABFS16_05485 [Bacteroidota bacterium]